MYNNFVYSIALQPDGKILIGGGFTKVGDIVRNYIARLNPDGTLDTIFNPNANGSIRSIVVQPDGKVIIGGDFRSIGGLTRNYIARLNPNGTLDTTFNPSANGIILSIALQSDGGMVVGGYFTTIGDNSRHYIARLNPDGTLYTAFNANANGPVYATAIQSDGMIVIGGSFNAIGGASHNSIARLINTDAAVQELQATADGTTVRWMRSGSGPEVDNVWFEKSSDLNSWTSLGTGSRISGGWELSGLGLALKTNIYIRARGFAKGGSYNASTSIIESVGAFYLDGHTLTVTKAGTGSGTVTATGINCGTDCVEIYNSGTVVYLNASPDISSTFAGWSGDCNSNGEVTMNSDKVCTATFTLNTYTVTTTGTNGIITSTNNPTVNHGSTTTVTGSANANYYFTGVSGCGGTLQTNTDQSVTTFSYTTGAINDNCTVSADFAIKTYMLTVTKDGTGGGTVIATGISCGTNCTENYTYGTNVILTAIPDSTSIFTDWIGDTDCSDGSVTMTADKLCKAVFTRTYTLSVSKSGSGSLTCTPESVSSHGSFECTLMPNSGHHLQSLLDNTSDVTAQIAGNKYTVTNVTADHTIQATFLQNLVLRITGANTETWYTLIQDAFDAALGGDDILTLSSDFNEFLNFDRPVSITLQGGCSPDFDILTGCTTLNGDLTISKGTVVIENLIIK